MQFSTDSILIKMVVLKELFCFIIKLKLLGKIFIKDFLEELEMQEIEVKDTEVKSISKFADTEGQVFRYKIIFFEPPIFP